jgi:iron donor protein CyaY
MTTRAGSCLSLLILEEDRRNPIVPMKEELEFKHHAEDALDRLYRALSDAADDYDFEPELEGGAVRIEFEHPRAKFVVSPNAPARQIWVSAHSRSFKLDWDPVESAFIYSDTGLTLMELVAEQISKQLGKEVSL